MGCAPSRPRPRRAAPQPSAPPPDAPLTPAAPWSTTPRVAPGALRRCRADFWASRVEGSAEMWAALRAAADAARGGDEELARGVLDAALLKTADGGLGKVYDERGVLYEVPRWVLRDPEGAAEGGEVCREIKVAEMLLQDLEEARR